MGELRRAGWLMGGKLGAASERVRRAGRQQTPWGARPAVHARPARRAAPCASLPLPGAARHAAAAASPARRAAAGGCPCRHSPAREMRGMVGWGRGGLAAPTALPHASPHRRQAQADGQTPRQAVRLPGFYAAQHTRDKQQAQDLPGMGWAGQRKPSAARRLGPQHCPGPTG